MKLDVPDPKGITALFRAYLKRIEREKQLVVTAEEKAQPRTQPFLVDTVGENGRPSKSFTKPVPKSDRTDVFCLSGMLILVTSSEQVKCIFATDEKVK